MNPAIVQIGVTFGLKTLQWWLAAPPDEVRPKRNTQEPTTHEGDPYLISYGRTRITRPLVAWRSIDISVKTPDQFEDIESNSEGVGPPEYGVNMLFNLGLIPGLPGPSPLSRLLSLWLGNDRLQFDMGHTDAILCSNNDGPTAALDAVKFITSVGLVRGRIQFFAGTSIQLISDNDPASVATPPDLTDLTLIAHYMRVDQYRHGFPNPMHIPGYRGQAIVAMTGDTEIVNLDAFFFGAQEILPPISFELQTQFTLYGTGTADGDANPVDVIYDILTNPFGRVGLDSSLIDAASFSAVGAALDAEGHGFSYTFSSTTNAYEALRMVVEQIGASLFFDPVSNSIKLKLIRDDYDAATIPRFTSDHVARDPDIEYNPGTWENTPNSIEIIYIDRQRNYEQASVVEQNSASAVVQSAAASDGRLRHVSIEYAGCTNRTLATKLAKRDLSYLSQPLATVRLSLNRLVDVTGNYNATDLRPGDVFRLDMPSHGIHDVVFRVERAEPGQLGDNSVSIDAAQDPFFIAGSDDDAVDDGSSVGYIAVPTPINHRRIEEAPRWMLQQAADRGIIDSANKQRIWTHAIPDDNAITYQAHSAITSAFVGDVPETGFVSTFILQTAMTREAEPYDDTTNYYGSFGDPAIAAAIERTWDPDDIRNDGRTLIIIDDEIMAYEVAVDDGGSGDVIFSKIWRGLLDTPATAHAIGARGWRIGTSVGGLAYIGRRAWPQLAGVSVKLLARLGLSIGSGGDPSDVIDFRLRTQRQYPVHNLAICGETMTGTQGLPTQAADAPALGYFKSASVLEEDIVEVAYKTRDKNNLTILRGDDGSEDPTDIVAGGVSVEWRLSAQKVGDDEVTLCDEISADGNSGTELHALLGQAGHGDIDVIMHTVKTTPAGKYGIPPATSVIDEWEAPRIRVWAPHWRNLLANPRWSYAFDSATASTGDGRGYWHATSGTPARAQSTNSLTRSATGWYATGSAGLSGCVFEQVIDISGYRPRGMRCGSWFYVHNLNADAGDTIAIDVVALNAAGATLATQSLSAFSAPTTTWRKVTIAHSALPANTAKIRILVALAPVSGGDVTADTALTEVSTYVGDFLDDVLSGPSFDASGTGWTNVVNSFAYPTTLPFADRNGAALNYAQGGAFASSEIRQDYTVPAGREFGTFVLRFWRMNEGNNDTGNVIVEARNGGGVLASTSTGVEAMTTQNIWFARRLHLELPDGTTTVRVRLVANRAGGAGNSGASFDEFHAQMHSDLDPAYERELLLSSPTIQQMPSTWQAWHTTYPDIIDDGIRAPLVIGPSTFASGTTAGPTLRLRWQDGVARTPDQFVGQWGGGRGSINGTRFARQSGASALDLQSFAEHPLSRACSPTADASFSVVVFFRVDEASFATACGIVGRCDGTTGWELTINASGELQAVLRGDVGTKTATRTGVSVVDGAVHMAVLVYDAATDTLTIWDELGFDSTSTAAGMGDFANNTMSTVLRVGRSRSTIDTIPGVIGPVYYFGHALGASHIVGDPESIWQYALEPNGTALTTSRSVPHFVDGPANDAGCTLALLSEEQLAFGYYDVLADPGDDYVGESMGLALCRGTTNLVPSWNFAGASWVADVGVSLVQSIVDPTGRKTGVTLVDINVGVGFKVVGLSMTATTTLTVVFYARAESGTPNIDVQLMNASDVVKQTVTIPLSTQWQRLTASFTAWDNSTPTARVRWKANAAKISIDLGGVVYACQGTEQPTMFNVAAAGVMADVYATLAETLPLEFNAQGEIIAEGTSRLSTPAANGSIVGVENGSNNNNARELIAQSTTPRLNHYDATTPTNVTSTGSAIDWNQFWQLRGRWCSTQLLDNAVTPFAGIVVDGDVDSAVYGRSATFSYSAVANDLIQLGKGASGNAPLSCYLRRVVIRAREEKLP